MINKKAALQLSFGWIFALIVGMTILFLAIYGVTKLISTSESSGDLQTSKEFEVLLNPLETGFESGSSVSINFPSETRVYNLCENYGKFGQQGIQTSSKSFNKWSEPSTEIYFENRYIFSENVTEGKKFYLFSKPFNLPFKVSDVIYMTSSEKNYCFISPPESVKTEILSLKQPNLFVDECPSESINICFAGGSGNCDISVNYNAKRVVKERDDMYFVDDATMYAAIFSDKSTYYCHFGRLIKRNSILAGIYNEKAQYLTSRNCAFNIQSDLISLENQGDIFSENIGYFTNIVDLAETLESKNDLAECKLW